MIAAIEHVDVGGGGNAGGLRSVADLDRMIAQSLRDVPDDDDDDLSDTDDPDLLVSHTMLLYYSHSHCEMLFLFSVVLA